MEVRFYGHPCPSYAKTGYLCEWAKAMLPSYAQQSENDPVAGLLSEMVDIAHEHSERAWDLHAGLARLATLRGDSFVRGAGLWLCSGPAALCALLHVTEPTQPMLVWHCRHLLDGLGGQPNGTSTAMLALFRSMAAVRPGAAISFLACEAFAARQAAWTLGLPQAPPVHRKLALYAETFRWAAFGPEGKPADVLVMRSMLWSRLPGMYFRTVLEAFGRENKDVLQLSFRFAADGPLMPYSEMARYRCGVLVPNDLTMAAFAEAYAMGLPIFLPSDEWLYRLQKSVPYGFMVHAGRLPVGADAGGEEQAAGEQHSPFWKEKSRGLVTVLSWLRLSDFSTWPHAQRFGSIPELLQGLASEDLESVSQGMRSWVAKGKSEEIPRWYAAVASILEAGAQAQVGHTSPPADASPESPQQSAAPSSGRSRGGIASLRADLLYAGFACEHESFDAKGWPSFRAIVEASSMGNFPANDDTLRITESILARENVSEEDVRDWNAGMLRFLKAAQDESTGDANSVLPAVEAALRGLGGRCHLGLVSALLLHARQELAGQDRPSTIAYLVTLAAKLIEPLHEMAARGQAKLPLGAWPVDELMTTVSALMDAKARMQAEARPGSRGVSSGSSGATRFKGLVPTYGSFFGMALSFLPVHCLDTATHAFGCFAYLSGVRGTGWFLVQTSRLGVSGGPPQARQPQLPSAVACRVPLLSTPLLAPAWDVWISSVSVAFVCRSSALFPRKFDSIIGEFAFGTKHDGADHYRTFGVAPDAHPGDLVWLNASAGPRQVRLAYNKLVLQCHPDKNQGSFEASEKFREAPCLRTIRPELAHPESPVSGLSQCVEFRFCLLLQFRRLNFLTVQHHLAKLAAIADLRLADCLGVTAMQQPAIATAYAHPRPGLVSASKLLRGGPA
ncbi:unnamed protein product [Polarella glacialis]|uniref:J domain-containing protein n=1 Tax=Polarella glacialis TaxID=89957 RepID=A0A813GM29_POLGL|nr:unnamed protein product [Polarella glacialis]